MTGYDSDLFFLIFIYSVLLIFGMAVLTIIHAIISRTTSRMLQGAILFLVALSGCLLFIDWDIPSIGLLVLGIPMAVILPWIQAPGPASLKCRSRILASYVIIFLFVVVSSVFWVPEIYRKFSPINSRIQTEIPNAVVYVGVTVLAVILAAIFYRLMDAYDAKNAAGRSEVHE